MISGFSYVHNALSVGIPIRESIKAVRPYVDEMVIVDASSTDGTTEMLSKLPEVDRVIDGVEWGDNAGETLKRLHAMNVECEGDVIIHFEADEVFDDRLIGDISDYIMNGGISANVYRIQVEQNFQRIRWYTEQVHRIFEKGTVKKIGHTTDTWKSADVTPLDFGLIWDVTNCFRDNWLARVEQQAKLWGSEPNYCMVPLHANNDFKVSREQAIERLNEPHWEFKTTPLNIPDILKPLVGKTKYE